jgi:hypothetical protein
LFAERTDCKCGKRTSRNEGMIALSECLDKDAPLAWLGARGCAVECGPQSVPDELMVDHSNSRYRDVVVARRPQAGTVANHAEWVA